MFFMIEKIVFYTDWANKELIKVLEQISEEKFTRELDALFANDTNTPTSSIRSLTEHIMMGLHFSSSIMLEREFEAEKTINSFRTMSKKELLQKWQNISEEFVKGFKQSLGKKVTFKDREIAITEDFVFAFTNHVVYHRGQLNTALKMVGEKTEDADYGDYSRQKTNTQ